MTAAAILPEWLRGRLARESAAASIEIAPDELAPVSLFLACATQWRRRAMTGQRMGLDYAAVPATAGMLDMRMTPALFADLRHMEDAALDALAEAGR